MKRSRLFKQIAKDTASLIDSLVKFALEEGKEAFADKKTITASLGELQIGKDRIPAQIQICIEPNQDNYIHPHNIQTANVKSETTTRSKQQQEADREFDEIEDKIQSTLDRLFHLENFDPLKAMKTIATTLQDLEQAHYKNNNKNCCSSGFTSDCN